VYRIWPLKLRSVFNLSIHCLVCCIAACLLQILYATIDPYGWYEVINICLLVCKKMSNENRKAYCFFKWAFYYFSYASACAAFTLCLLRWVRMSRALILWRHSTSARVLNGVFKFVAAYCVSSYGIIFLLCAPAIALGLSLVKSLFFSSSSLIRCFTACYCDGANCSTTLADQIFLSFWWRIIYPPLLSLSYIYS